MDGAEYHHALLDARHRGPDWDIGIVIGFV